MNLRASPSRFGFAGGLLLAGLLLWTVAAWPLPRYFTLAIPHTNLNPDSQTVRPLASGDHLQLLYHFWLGLDALSGHSPLFHNVYEFNLGDDRGRLQPDLYYMPFSLVYAAIAPVAGHAAGWNAAGLASVLLGVLFLGLLARRFTASVPAALLATLIAAAFPYRWITLFTGSPTGFAMAFPPLLAYGLDRAIRDRSSCGGLLAGLALFFSYMADLHVFYFSALAAPGLALLSFARTTPAPREWLGSARRAVLPLLPFAVLAAAAVGISALMSRHLAGSVMSAGRTIAEISSYSPSAAGLVSTARAGMANHAYFGIPLFALLATALALWTGALFRRDASERPPLADRIAVFALVAGVAAVVLLALGAHAPLSGLPIRAARKLVPKYTMIRQTVKIYGLLPALLAPLLAILLASLFRPGRRPVLRLAAIGLGAGLSLWTLLQALEQTSPGFCRLPFENTAYAAVAADAPANAGRPAHALALPLWPGDSHWASLYEYAVMLSRVRLVNGYAPAVPSGYFEDIFKKYESLNQGVATDAQLDGLLALGVRHLLLHANAFPEQVSPFPAAATLRALTGHPRLAMIADDGQIFAFRILPKHPVEHTPHANWPFDLHAAARHWTWNPPLEIPNAQTAPLRLRAPVFPAPGLRYLVRLPPGSAQPLLVPPGSEGISRLTHPIAGLPDWLQAELPSPTGALASAISGPVALRQALLTAGDLPAPAPDGSIRILPALLFHSGHSAPGQSAVLFFPETVPAGVALYGPNLPVPPGVYDLLLTYSVLPGETESPGTFRIRTFPGPDLLAEAPLDPATNTLALRGITLDADPIRFEFDYASRIHVSLFDIRLAPSIFQLRPAAP
ncbi:MAG: hypothetical protein EOM72_07010 [Opitutae bacterium]|nr:hypothetical protein [Opitutae bacterium]